MAFFAKYLKVTPPGLVDSIVIVIIIFIIIIIIIKFIQFFKCRQCILTPHSDLGLHSQRRPNLIRR